MPFFLIIIVDHEDFLFRVILSDPDEQDCITGRGPLMPDCCTLNMPGQGLKPSVVNNDRQKPQEFNKGEESQGA